MITPHVALGEITLMSEAAGGGSFWSGDNLLATLDVRRRPDRTGRLSIRSDGRACELVCAPSNGGLRYRITEGPQEIGQAEWQEGNDTARLEYQGHEYMAGRTGLYEGQEPVIRLNPADWNGQQTLLRLARPAELPLVAFYVFVVYDQRPEG